MTRADAPPPRRHEYLAMPWPHVFAHRGLHEAWPENTIPAFRAALAAGATHLETDAHATADGVAVLSHDPVLPAGLARRGRVRDHSLAELRRLDLGGGTGYASLAEALAEFPDARFNIDVKSGDAIGPVVAAVRAASAERRVLIASFAESRRRRVARALPDAATSASSARLCPALAAAALGADGVVRMLLRDIHAVQLPERFRGVRVVTARTVRTLRAAGLEVDVWTVNEESAMRRLLDLGVDGLITDRSDRAVAVVASRR